MNRRRVLIATPSAHPTLGGLETVTQLLCDALLEMDIDVRVLVTANPSKKQQSAERRYSHVRAFRTAKGCDLIIVANATLRALPLWLIFWRRVVLQHHSDYSHADALGTRGRLAKRLRFLWISRARNVCVSPWICDRIPAKDRVVILNPLEPWPAEPGARDTCSMLFAARLVEEKGLHNVIPALRLLPNNYRLIVCGDGPLTSRYQQLAQDLGVESRIDWRGVAPRPVVRNLMQSVEWVLVPSSYEPFGMTALEGAASGAKLLVSNAGNLPTMFGNLGHVCDVSRPQAIAECLLECCGHTPDPRGIEELLRKTAALNIARQYVELASGE